MEYYKILKDEEVEKCKSEFDEIDKVVQNLKVSLKCFLDLKKNKKRLNK